MVCWANFQCFTLIVFAICSICPFVYISCGCSIFHLNLKCFFFLILWMETFNTTGWKFVRTELKTKRCFSLPREGWVFAQTLLIVPIELVVYPICSSLKIWYCPFACILSGGSEEGTAIHYIWHGQTEVHHKAVCQRLEWSRPGWEGLLLQTNHSRDPEALPKWPIVGILSAHFHIYMHVISANELYCKMVLTDHILNKHVSVFYVMCAFYYISDVSKVSVLIPGAGLGRLAWEIARLGYSCQGNEWSFFMLFSSNFVLNR